MSGESALAPATEACWRAIGVRGDRSCPKLAQFIHCQNCNVFSEAARTLLVRPAEPTYLREMTGFVAEPAASRARANRSLLLFEVADERFGVWVRDVLEVTTVTAPRRVPHRSDHVFLGLVNIQGRLELCLSLRGLLGLAPEPYRKDARRAIVVQSGAERWVFAVDSIRGMHRVAGETLREPPTSSRRDQAFITRLASEGGERFGVLDVARLCEAAGEHVR